MKTQYDMIIIGGGHNGLVAAATLAKAGKKVLVLEKRPNLGGAAATEELFPGFKMDTGATDAGMFQDEIVQALALSQHGLTFQERDVLFVGLGVDGRSLTIFRDMGKTQAEIAKFSQRDAEKYPAFVQQINNMTDILREMLLRTPPDLMARNVGELFSWGKVGLKLKRQGNKELMEFMRVLPMPANDFLNEWFETDLLKGVLGADALTGSVQGPRAAGTALTLLYQHINGFGQSRTVAGGMGALSAAVASAAKQAGAEIRANTAVSHIQVDDAGVATAVVLQNGDKIAAQAILSSVDPQHTFLEMVGPQQLEPRFVRQVRNIIYRGSTARLNLALSGLPQVVGVADSQRLTGRIRLAPSLDYLEQASDAAKYGEMSAKPYLEVSLPSLSDASLAPTGQHTMSITMKYAPYDLQDGWENGRNQLTQRILDVLAPTMPNLAELILHQQLITPLDYAQSYGLAEGSIYQGQMSLDQLLVMRPVPAWGRYVTPIQNLYLCGAGAHPGGGVTGAPGYNAARELLQAL